MLSRVLVLFVLWISLGEARAERTINAVIGDASWHATHAGPPAGADEVTRIRTHLVFVLARLRARDVAGLPVAVQQARAVALADLVRYSDGGVFPRRHADTLVGRWPRFIDDRGVHCAVGQLIADSGAAELARAINRRNEYAYVQTMQEPALLDWAAAHGFTVTELAMIQPTYDEEVPAAQARVIGDKDDIALKCARRYTSSDKLRVGVSSDPLGLPWLTTSERDPFAQCFVREGNLRPGYHQASGDQPAAVLELTFTPPQKLLDQTLARWNLTSGCYPRPGALAREATLQLVSNSAGLHVNVTTVPANAEVARCIELAVTASVQDFGAGVWNLQARQTLKLLSNLTGVESVVRKYARQYALDCEPKLAQGAAVQIAVTAQPEDPRFTIAVDGAAPLATCLREKLQAQLIKQYTVERTLPDGTHASYFRIDSAVDALVTIQLAPKTERDVHKGDTPSQRSDRR